jgi:hypothetical protein
MFTIHRNSSQVLKKDILRLQNWPEGRRFTSQRSREPIKNSKFSKVNVLRKGRNLSKVQVTEKNIKTVIVVVTYQYYDTKY